MKRAVHRPVWLMRLHERQRVQQIAAHMNFLLGRTGCTVRVMRPHRYLRQS